VDAYTEECLEQGYSEAQMTEAVQVAAVVRSGSSLMHGLQMKDAADRLRKREE
jgi:4-carboxymuconolactone decarboxylase